VFPSNVCNYMKKKTNACYEELAVTEMTESGIYKFVYEANNDPTVWKPHQERLYNMLMCESLESEGGETTGNPSSKEYCMTVGWHNAQDGAFKTFVRQLVKYLKGERVTVNQHDTLVDTHVLKIRNQALATYCRYFSGQMYNILEAKADGSESGFKKSQFTNFVSKCQAQCVHHAGKSPLVDPYLSETVKGTDMDVMVPAVSLFNPAFRAGVTDRVGVVGADYDKYGVISDSMDYWATHPRANPKTVMNKIGIKLNEYLKRMQRKSLGWSLYSGGNEWNVKRLADAENFNYQYHKVTRNDDTHDHYCSTLGPDSKDNLCSCESLNPVPETEGTAKYYLDQIIPYHMCQMKKRIEFMQRSWLYKNTRFFHENVLANEDSRMPNMMRREMAEVYCTEFCTYLPVNKDLPEADEKSWKEGPCMRSCMMPFPRCSNARKC